jgi:peptidyl-tRNA hydrolase
LAPGQRIAQAVHAALDYAVGFPDLVAEWSCTSNYLVVLECSGEQEIFNLIRRALALDVNYLVVEEPDYPLEKAVTALVMGPGPAASRICSSLPLAFRKEAAVA